jgi:hypothetical protein
MLKYHGSVPSCIMTIMFKLGGRGVGWGLVKENRRFCSETSSKAWTISVEDWEGCGVRKKGLKRNGLSRRGDTSIQDA